LYAKWQSRRGGIILDSADLNPNLEIPAFAEAASRRQAKFETISNDRISNVQNKSTA